MNIFLANSKEHNWDLCVAHKMFGVKETKIKRKLPDIHPGDMILMRVSGTKNNGVKSIWLFKKVNKVNPTTFVPWKDAKYEWVMECEPIVTFHSLFKEDFHGYGSYSSKIKEFPSSRIQPSLIQLKVNEYRGYFENILKEYNINLNVNFEHNGDKILLHKLLSNISSGKPINYAIQDSKLLIETNDESVKEDSLSKYNSMPNSFASDREEPVDESIRTNIIINRIIRDTILSAKLKSKYDFKCQLCGNTISAENGRKYAEAHHIQPLGTPHNGPDKQENIICLCPNCHVKLDYGIIEIKYEKIFFIKGHNIHSDYIEYHNSKIYNKILSV